MIGGGVRRAAGRGFGQGWGAGPPAGRAEHVGRSLRRLAGRLRPEWPRLVVAVAAGAAGVGLTVLGPRILGTATNVIFNGVVGREFPKGLTKAQVLQLLRSRHQDQLAALVSGTGIRPGVGVNFGELGTTLGMAALVYLGGAILSWAQTYVMAGIAQRTVSGLRRDVEAKLARLPLRFFDSHAHGDILSRVTNDIDNITTTVQQGLSQLLTSVLTVVGVAVMMLTIDPILALVSLTTVPVAAGVTALIARRSQRQFTDQWRWTGTLNGHVEEMHTGHALVQVFGQRQEVVGEFHRQNEELYRASFRAQFLSGIIQPAIQVLANLNYVLIAAIGGYRVVTGAISLGDVQAFIQYSRQFTMPIVQIANQMNLLQSGLASSDRVFEFLDAPEEATDLPQAASRPATGGQVTFDQVAFRYAPDEPLIEDFTLQVAPGQTVAIVGPTGAGKTTIVNLLMRFYEVDAGAIRLDGVDTRQLTREAVRATFGMVLQDTWLFAGTIRANIAYGRADASDEAIEAAGRAAHVDHFVRTLADGYDTVLDEDASNLSTGQRQLLAIARAFLKDPAILILDEATSSVDTRTEVLVQAAMAQLRRGRTSFVIAHLLSTIRDADTIIVMDHGRIVEQGRHLELLARGGFYHDLYRSQFPEALAATG